MDLRDSYGDGWNGATWSALGEVFTLADGYFGTENVQVPLAYPPSIPPPHPPPLPPLPPFAPFAAQGFESASLGPGWSTGSTGTAWTRISGGTASPDTGPSMAYEGSYYMYTETSSPRVTGDRFDLKYSCPNSTMVAQVDWWYHMYGAQMGSLILKSGRDVVGWQKSGNQGNSWQFASVLAWSTFTTLVFEGVRGTSFRSDVAIDDVVVYCAPFPPSSPPSPPTLPPPPFPPPFPPSLPQPPSAPPILWHSCQLTVSAVFGGNFVAFSDLTIQDANGDPVSNMTATSSCSSFPAGEEADKGLDGDNSTKFLCYSLPTDLIATFGIPTSVATYDIVTANDFPHRDPKSWTFDCRFTAGDAWVQLSSVIDAPAIAGRYTSYGGFIAKASPPPAPPSSPNPVAVIQGDPHVRGAHGDSFDLKGADGSFYVLLSAPAISISAMFSHASFFTPFSKLWVHGSWIKQVFWTLRTPSRRVLHLYLNATSASFNMCIKPCQMTIEGVGLEYTGKSLSVVTARWRTRATVTDGRPHKGQVRMRIEVQPRYDVLRSKVAPHGLLGQTYDSDGLPVHGARDSYERLDDGTPTRSRNKEGGHVTTRAAGEGAIEGTLEMYRVAHPYDTKFAYSRFDKVAAPSRDIKAMHPHKLPEPEPPRPEPKSVPQNIWIIPADELPVT